MTNSSSAQGQCLRTKGGYFARNAALDSDASWRGSAPSSALRDESALDDRSSVLVR
jgi:hypothetical protein